MNSVIKYAILENIIIYLSIVSITFTGMFVFDSMHGLWSLVLTLWLNTNYSTKGTK